MQLCCVKLAVHSLPILAVNELYGVETLPSKQVARLLGKITPQSSNKSPIFSLIFSKNTLNSSFYKQMAA